LYANDLLSISRVLLQTAATYIDEVYIFYVVKISDFFFHD